MPKYSIQVLYIKYVEVQADDESEAITEAQQIVRGDILVQSIEETDLTFTVTDEITEE